MGNGRNRPLSPSVDVCHAWDRHLHRKEVRGLCRSVSPEGCVPTEGVSLPQTSFLDTHSCAMGGPQLGQMPLPPGSVMSRRPLVFSSSAGAGGRAVHALCDAPGPFMGVPPK